MFVQSIQPQQRLCQTTSVVAGIVVAVFAIIQMILTLTNLIGQLRRPNFELPLPVSEVALLPVAYLIYVIWYISPARPALPVFRQLRAGYLRHVMSDALHQARYVAYQIHLPRFAGMAMQTYCQQQNRGEQLQRFPRVLQATGNYKDCCDAGMNDYSSIAACVETLVKALEQCKIKLRRRAEQGAP